MSPRNLPSPPDVTRRDLLRLLAAAPLFGACRGPSVLSQAGLQPVPPDGLPRELPAPLLRPGYEWRMVTHDELTGLVSERMRVVVTRADADGYDLTETLQAGNVYEVRYDRSLNLVRWRNRAFAPAYPRFAFPLAIGKTWRVDVRSSAIPAVRYGTLIERVSAVVRGWERVTVPAGTFTALRIELALNWRDTDAAGVWGNSSDTFWYAPEVRNAVLRHRVDYPQDGAQSNNIVTEVESFNVGA
jgi:hypothetical protein